MNMPLLSLPILNRAATPVPAARAGSAGDALLFSQSLQKAGTRLPTPGTRDALRQAATDRNLSGPAMRERGMATNRSDVAAQERPVRDARDNQLELGDNRAREATNASPSHQADNAAEPQQMRDTDAPEQSSVEDGTSTSQDSTANVNHDAANHQTTDAEHENIAAGDGSAVAISNAQQAAQQADESKQAAGATTSTKPGHDSQPATQTAQASLMMHTPAASSAAASQAATANTNASAQQAGMMQQASRPAGDGGGDPAAMNVQPVVSETSGEQGGSSANGSNTQTSGGAANQAMLAAMQPTSNSTTTFTLPTMIGDGGSPLPVAQQAQPLQQAGMQTNQGQPAPSTAGMFNAEQTHDPVNAARLARGLQNALQQQGGGLTLRLTPPDMGTVRIQLSIQGATVAAQFHAESEAGRTLLHQQMAQLRHALESQGLQVERLSVQTMQNSNASQMSDQNSHNSANDGRSKGEYTGQSSTRDQNNRDNPNNQQQQPDFEQMLFSEVA